MKQRLFLFTAILLALISCSGDNDPDNEKNGGGSSNKDYLTVKVNIPVLNEVQTYALTAADESSISEIDVLMFDKADDKFIKRLRGTEIIDAADAISGNKKEFKIKIPDSGAYSKVYFLVIANCSNHLDSQTGLMSETDRHSLQSIMDGLFISYRTAVGVLGDKKWPIRPARFERFPMFGISPDIDLSQSDLTVPPITLIRSIAKIDVGVNFDTNQNPAMPKGLNPTTDNTFKIESVTVCNALDTYQVTPFYSRWNRIGPITQASEGLYGRSVGDLTYTWLPSERETSDKLGMQNRIYITEHDKASRTDDRVNKVLYTIIGGYFTEKGKPENKSKITYYRVDFLKSTKDSNGVITAQEPLAILRNHLYRINIVKVQGEGYSTINEAKNSMGNNNNMMVDITNDDESISDIVYDGEYMLGVEKKSFFFDKNNIRDSVAVRTTHPQGWKAVVTEGNGWISLTNSSQSAAGISNFKFSLTKNTTSDVRNGKITITSGRMTQVIEVKQVAMDYISTENVFSLYWLNGNTYSFKVKSTSAWTASVIPMYDHIITSYTTSGPASSEGTIFTFQLADDLLNLQIGEEYAWIRFESVDSSFPHFDVQIRAVSAFDITNLWVYPNDQNSKLGNWYTFSNTPDGINEVSTIPPTTGRQASPVREHSCASIKSGESDKPWRLPTMAELHAIEEYLTQLTYFDAYKRYYFTKGDLTYYVSANSGASASDMNKAYGLLFNGNSHPTSSWGLPKNGSPIGSEVYKYRCVRSK